VSNEKVKNHEEVVAVHWRRPLYESHYLKGNSPDGTRAFWFKHTLLCFGPAPEQRILELWAMIFERGYRPVVAKMEIPWTEIQVGPGPYINCKHARLESDSAWGSMSDIRWELSLSGGLGPLIHLPWRWLYSARSPTAKALTPATNLVFDGILQCGARTWDLERWVGLRGHNWSHEHAFRYTWLAVNKWNDSPGRSLEGFVAQPRLWMPTFRRATLRDPDGDHRRIGMGFWSGGDPGACKVKMRFPLMQVSARAEPEDFVHLIYRQPQGGRILCRCTKFAEVRVNHRGRIHTSDQGELEFLDSRMPLGENCHPHPDWTAAEGIYRSQA
jgi:hypothetical protein